MVFDIANYDNCQVEHIIDETFWECDMHFHDYYECLLFISGNVAWQVNGYSVDIKPNSLIMLKPNQLHRPILYNMAVPYDRYILRIPPQLISLISTSNTNLSDCLKIQNFEPKQIPVSESRKLISLFEKLETLNRSNQFGADILSMAYLAEAIVMICDLFLHPSSEVIELTMTHSHLITEIIDFIDKHIKEPICLDDIAAEVHLCKHYLSRIFKQETNISVYKFILQKRLMFARDLLTQGVFPTDVYILCGLKDYSNFYRAFRNEFGISPKHYQKNFLHNRS
jgi:AraC-like DNA-binding protein